MNFLTCWWPSHLKSQSFSLSCQWQIKVQNHLNHFDKARCTIRVKSRFSPSSITYLCDLHMYLISQNLIVSPHKKCHKSNYSTYLIELYELIKIFSSFYIVSTKMNVISLLLLLLSILTITCPIQLSTIIFAYP